MGAYRVFFCLFFLFLFFPLLLWIYTYLGRRNATGIMTAQYAGAFLQ
jgi:hypothetical protein